jgi:hypothetical protein
MIRHHLVYLLNGNLSQMKKVGEDRYVNYYYY